MAIPGFELPRVTLEQSYAPVPTSTVRTLSVVCIGPRYSLHRADVASEAAEIDQTTDKYTSSNGLLEQPLPGFKLGGSVDVNDTETQRLVVKDGIFSYATATKTTDYTVSSSMATFSSLILKSGEGGVASAAFGSRGVRVGDPVILKTTGGDVYTEVRGIRATAGTGYNILVLASEYASTLAAATSLVFCEKMDFTYEQDTSGTFYIDETDEGYEVNVLPGLTATLNDISKTTTGTLEAGDFYVEYRERMTAGKGELGTLSSLSEIESELGGVGVENPLALACYFAMAGGGSNAVVYYTVVTEDTPAAYVAACDFLAKFNMLYSVVPCTGDEDIVQQCMASCIGYSNDINSKIRRALWYGIDLPENITLWTGTVSSVSDNAITLSGDVFIDYPAQEGDIVKLTADPYTEYTIARTNGVNVAYLTLGDESAPAADAGVTLIRTQPSHAALIAQLIAMRKARSTSERGQCVWADGIKFNGETVPNFAAAAAAAGMRASEPCQRPLSNLGYSFFTVEDIHGFTLGELEQIGAEGIWMIGSNSNGLAVNLRQVTTAASGNLLMDEESIISNADTIAINLSHMGEEYVGNSNITPELLDLLRTLLGAYLSDCTVNYTGSILIGPQLLSWNIINIWQDPVNLDHVYAEIEVEPPRPFNRFHIIMRVI